MIRVERKNPKEKKDQKKNRRDCGCGCVPPGKAVKAKTPRKR